MLENGAGNTTRTEGKTRKMGRVRKCEGRISQKKGQGNGEK